MDHHGTGADPDVVADLDIAQYFGARADYYAVAQGRVALAGFITGAAQGDPLIEQDIVTDLGGFPDHYAHSMVDKEPAANGGPRVNFDAGEETAYLGNEARQQGNTPAIQFMGKTVRQNGMEAGVAEKDLDDRFGGGIFAEDSLELFPNGSKHTVTDWMARAAKSFAFRLW